MYARALDLVHTTHRASISWLQRQLNIGYKDAAHVMSLLEERGLIEPCGHLDAPGRPTIFRTTPNFLRVFGLSSIEELPELPEEGSDEDQLKLQSSIDALQMAREEAAPREEPDGEAAPEAEEGSS